MKKDDLKQLKAAVELSPDNVPLRLHLSAMLYNHGYYEEAEREFLTVLKYDPANQKAKFGLAKSYARLNKTSAAQIVLEELLEIQPQNIQYLIFYCELLIDMDDKESALEHYKKILIIEPEFRDERLDSLFRIGMTEAQEEFDDDAIGELMKPDFSFDDIGGMQREKEEISMKIIQPLKYPELYKSFGKKIGGGILFYGPPGCGKTHLARCTAGEISSSFINVGINDILDMWVGSSERNLHELFERARAARPAVLFIDEIDALGAKRSDMRHSGGRAMINQLLAELDGMSADNEGVLILGATNAPWHMDPALRRPGRFDRIIFVAPPDEEARLDIWNKMLREKPVNEIDLKRLARASRDFSGADIGNAIDLAIEENLKASFKSGELVPLSTKGLISAIKRHKPTTQEWFKTARNYALYANDSGLYDDILNYLNIKR